MFTFHLSLMEEYFVNKNTVADTKLLGKRPQNCSLLAGQNLLFHYMRSVLL